MVAQQIKVPQTFKKGAEILLEGGPGSGPLGLLKLDITMPCFALVMDIL